MEPVDIKFAPQYVLHFIHAALQLLNLGQHLTGNGRPDHRSLVDGRKALVSLDRMHFLSEKALVDMEMCASSMKRAVSVSFRGQASPFSPSAQGPQAKVGWSKT